MKISEEQIQSFEEKGFLILEKFFSEAELKRFENTLRKIIQIQIKKARKMYSEFNQDFKGKEFDDGVIELDKINHQFIADIYDTIYSTSAFLNLASKKEITQCINQLIKRDIDDPLYLDQSRCRLDSPNDPNKKKCGWHQEVFYYIPKSQFVQTWAPLIHDAKKEMGAVEACIGSHKQIAKQSKTNPENEKYQFIVDESEVEKFQKHIMELNLGSLLIFDSRLIHRSGNNVSNKVRYSLVGINHNLDNEFFIPPRFTKEGEKEKFQEFYESTFSK